jgi:hypothetical protein
MTVPVQLPSISYIENGVTTDFAAPFRYDDPGDLRAVRRGSTGMITELVNGTDFTATPGETPAGGTVSFAEPGDSGVRLTIWRDTARAQDADYIESGAFTAASHQGAMDKAMLIAQEQDVEIARAVKVPVGEAGGTLPDAARRAGKVLRFDAFGEPIPLSMAELAVLLSPEKMAGLTEAFSQSFGARSQIVAFRTPVVDEGGYFVEFSPAAGVSFNRVYARVFAGNGTVDIRVLGGGVIWQRSAVGSVPVDETVDLALPAGFDLIVVIENIVGVVQGVVVFLEEVSE